MARREALAPEVLQVDATTNLSLWLERYNPGFDQETLRQHHTIATERVRAPEGYPAAFQRRKAALRAFTGDFDGGETRLYDLALAGRAVVGIGAASVRETSLALLRPWGVPYIPGSSLKGLTSHTAHREGPWQRPAEPGADAGELQRALFGDVTVAGAVVFHDAWLVPAGEKIPVACDAMTVHHARYYQGEGAPCDWDEPNPVSFLTMQGTYLAALTGPAEALDVAEALLREGLEGHGIGAKTASGYGRARLVAHVSELSRKLRGFERPPAAANTVQSQAQEFVAYARQARFPDEQRAARDAARRLVASSPKVWAAWVAHPARTEDERKCFQVDAPTVDPAPVSATSRPLPVAELRVERRQVRVVLVPDRKVANRFSLRVDGKEYKGHVVALPEGALERLRAAGADGVDVELDFENGRPRRT